MTNVDCAAELDAHMFLSMKTPGIEDASRMIHNVPWSDNESFLQITRNKLSFLHVQDTVAMFDLVGLHA